MPHHPSLMTLATAILIGSLALSSVAVAGAQEEADELAKQGIELRRRGDDPRALPLFERAHKIAPTPRSAIQLGTVEQALGRWADAEEHLAQGLRTPGDPWIKKNRAVIDESLRTVKTHIGSLEVTGAPSGAEVLVNGRKVGQLPLPAAIRVSAGDVDVELNAPGHLRGFRTVKVTAGDYQTVVLRLQPLEQPAPAPAVAAPVPAPPPARPWQRWAAFGAFGGAAAAAGIGTYGLVRFNDRVETFNAKCDEGPERPLAKATHQPDPTCDEWQSQYRSARTLSIVGFSLAGALAATGVVLLLTAPDAADTEPAVAWGCAPDLLHAGVTCAARF
jgi:hypothetical protein